MPTNEQTFIVCEKETFARLCRMWPASFQMLNGKVLEVTVNGEQIACHLDRNLTPLRWRIRQDYADFIRRSTI